MIGIDGGQSSGGGDWRCKLAEEGAFGEDGRKLVVKNVKSFLRKAEVGGEMKKELEEDWLVKDIIGLKDSSLVEESVDGTVGLSICQ